MRIQEDLHVDNTVARHQEKIRDILLSNAIKLNNFWENFSGENDILSGKSQWILKLPCCGNLRKHKSHGIRSRNFLYVCSAILP